MEWETVIGLEIHAQLATRSKIFSGASTAFGEEPNRQACPIDLGMPGVLPVLNEGAVAMAVRFGLAIEADIAGRSVFARKNYFYPDLPKGYQISQYEIPVIGTGRVRIETDDGAVRTVGITRAHLEEDAGKSLHEAYHGMTGVDLNRAGTPLLEIVSEPDLRSARDAVAYAKKIRTIVRYLGICDGNMQEGSLRVDANVSIRPAGSEAFGTRTEIKNVNSFRFLEKAVDFEVERQREILEDGGRVLQETRLYDPERHETRSMRTKEEANDYRYFPDPDLLPLEVDQGFIEAVRAGLPELPDAKRERFMRDYELPAYDAGVLTASRELADYYEAVVEAAPREPKLAANWVLSELGGVLNERGVDIGESPVSARALAGLIERIQDQTISGKIAKQVFAAMVAGEGSADAVIEARGLRQITDTSEIEAMIDDILAANPEQVEQYRGGKDKVLGWFVGQVMKASRGKANPDQVNRLLRARLDT